MKRNGRISASVRIEPWISQYGAYEASSVPASLRRELPRHANSRLARTSRSDAFHIRSACWRSARQ